MRTLLFGEGFSPQSVTVYPLYILPEFVTAITEFG